MSDNEPEDELLTTAEVAARLKIKESTVRRLVKDHKIPRIKVGDKLNRFLKSDIESYIKKRRS